METNEWEPSIYETVNDLDGVIMIVKEGIFSATGLTVILENNSDKQCIYGDPFSLEKKINGRWYQVPDVLDGNYGFTDIGYGLSSSDVEESSVD